MKPINIGGHSAYQNRVLTQLRKYYPVAANSLSSSTWQILDKFWNLDLSAVDALMQDRYSIFGPHPRLLSDMLRAILVSIEFKITSYTKFAAPIEKITVEDLFRQFEELLSLKRDELNIVVLKSLARAAPHNVLAKDLIPMLNMAETFTLLLRTIQDFLIIHPVTVLNGSWNITQEHLLNDVTNVRK